MASNALEKLLNSSRVDDVDDIEFTDDELEDKDIITNMDSSSFDELQNRVAEVESDIEEELIRPAVEDNSLKQAKSKVKKSTDKKETTSNSNLVNQFSNLESILLVLSDGLLDDIINSDYTYNKFNPEDTKVIVEFIKQKIND